MTSRRARGSLLFPLALVFVGVMFLLTNLDVVDASVWPQLAKYWPILLILMGVDTLFRRSSIGAAIGSILGAACLIAIILAAVAWFAPASWSMRQDSFAHPLNGATTAKITLACPDCTIQVSSAEHGGDAEDLIRGDISVGRVQRLTRSTGRIGDEARFQLEAHDRLPFRLWEIAESPRWDAWIAKAIPTALTVSTSNGVSLYLSDLMVSSLDVTAGSALSTITVPSHTSSTVYVSGQQIQFQIPNDVGVRVFKNALGRLDVPAAYRRTENRAESPDYEQATIRVDIYLRPDADLVEIWDPDDSGRLGTR